MNSVSHALTAFWRLAMFANVAILLSSRNVLAQDSQLDSVPQLMIAQPGAIPAADSFAPDLPEASAGYLDGPSTKLLLEDPLLFSPLQDPESELGFSLGETSLSEPVESAEQRVPVAPLNRVEPVRPGDVNPEELPEDVERRALLNAVAVSPRTITQRTALHQALSTGESILGNLSGVRGVIDSPFLPARHRELLPAFRIGPIDFRPHASVGVVVGHSSQNSDGGDDIEAGTFFQAGILAALRKTGRVSGALDYTIGTTPSFTQDNEIDQLLSVSTDFTIPQFSKVHFGLGLDYASLSTLDRDAGRVEKRTLITPALTMSYIYSRKTSFDWDFTVPIRDVSDGTSSVGVTSTFFVNNQITKKTQLGLGFAIGTENIEESTTGGLPSGNNTQGSVTQWFQQLLLRARYRPSHLFTFDGTVGLELREVGDSADLSPVFGFGAIWKPRLETEVRLAGEMRTFSAGTALNSNFTSTSIRIGVNQLLAYRLTGSLTLGYVHATYDADRESSQDGRVDNLFNVTAGVTYSITNRWSWTLTLSAGKNWSNVQPFDYVQGVLQTSYEF